MSHRKCISPTEGHTGMCAFQLFFLRYLYPKGKNLILLSPIWPENPLKFPSGNQVLDFQTIYLVGPIAHSDLKKAQMLCFSPSFGWALPHGGCQWAWLLGAAEAMNKLQFVFSDYGQLNRSRQKSATETWHRCSYFRCLIFHGFFLPYELHMALPSTQPSAERHLSFDFLRCGGKLSLQWPQTGLERKVSSRVFWTGFDRVDRLA